MLRLLTAGESHGQGPRRRPRRPARRVSRSRPRSSRTSSRGAGTGTAGAAASSSSRDRFEILTGVRHGRTLGLPDRDHDRQRRSGRRSTGDLMAVEGETDPADAPHPPPSRPRRPGRHAEVRVRRRPKRARSGRARARPRLGWRRARAARRSWPSSASACSPTSCASGRSAVPAERAVPGPEDLEAVDASPVRCLDPAAADEMVAEIDRLRKARDTVGGVFEVLVVRRARRAWGRTCTTTASSTRAWRSP